mmetsp:Transcript_4649/g.6124  ORF Transcript_4649/g.6124 Transcript_4649/m.6124 type:complete len:154 (+) Transcript_4649:53-514(+)
MSANFGQNAQTSVNHINMMPDSPVQHEQIEEVTETGFNAAEKDHAASEPEVYFHMKSMIKNNKVAPLAYLSAQTLILSPIVIGHFTTSSSEHHAELAFLFVVSFVALCYYLRCAWTNPGYLIGCAIDEAKKAGAYDPKLYAMDGDGNVTVELS